MKELGQLQKHHRDFERRNIQIAVVSNDEPGIAQQTQADFPDLIVVSDAKQDVARAFAVIDPGHGPAETDTNAPTTFLIDRTGVVRWVFRPDRFIERLSARELLAALDEHLPRD